MNIFKIPLNPHLSRLLKKSDLKQQGHAEPVEACCFVALQTAFDKLRLTKWAFSIASIKEE